jgi:hypothetical protein
MSTVNGRAGVDVRVLGSAALEVAADGAAAGAPPMAACVAEPCNASPAAPPVGLPRQYQTASAAASAGSFGTLLRASLA